MRGTRTARRTSTIWRNDEKNREEHSQQQAKRASTQFIEIPTTQNPKSETIVTKPSDAEREDSIQKRQGPAGEQGHADGQAKTANTVAREEAWIANSGWS